LNVKEFFKAHAKECEVFFLLIFLLILRFSIRMRYHRIRISQSIARASLSLFHLLFLSKDHKSKTDKSFNPWAFSFQYHRTIISVHLLCYKFVQSFKGWFPALRICLEKCLFYSFLCLYMLNLKLIWEGLSRCLSFYIFCRTITKTSFINYWGYEDLSWAEW
jgi:hypothetical protein